jgi:hypothetical protein
MCRFFAANNAVGNAEAATLTATVLLNSRRLMISFKVQTPVFGPYEQATLSRPARVEVMRST